MLILGSPHVALLLEIGRPCQIWTATMTRLDQLWPLSGETYLALEHEIAMIR